MGLIPEKDLEALQRIDANATGMRMNHIYVRPDPTMPPVNEGDILRQFQRTISPSSFDFRGGRYYMVLTLSSTTTERYQGSVVFSSSYAPKAGRFYDAGLGVFGDLIKYQRESPIYPAMAPFSKETLRQQVDQFPYWRFEAELNSSRTLAATRADNPNWIMWNRLQHFNSVDAFNVWISTFELPGMISLHWMEAYPHNIRHNKLVALQKVIRIHGDWSASQNARARMVNYLSNHVIGSQELTSKLTQGAKRVRMKDYRGKRV